MGNNISCCCSCCPFQPDNANFITGMTLAFDDITQIDAFISYLDQILNAIDQGGNVAKPDPVQSGINSGGNKVEEVLKRANRYTCKMGVMPKLDRETRKLVIDITKEGAQIKWLGIAFSVVAFVLDRIDQVSSNREECVELLKYMCNLAKYVRRLDNQLGELGQEKLNEVLEFIVKGSLMCVSQMRSDRLSRFFAASVNAEDLRGYQLKLGQKYKELSLETLINVLNGINALEARIPAPLPPSQGTTDNQEEAVGIVGARDDVKGLLDMENQALRVVVIYGQGGIGKTTLATAVFKSLDLKNYKFCRIDMEQNCLEGDITLSSWEEGRQELSKAFKKASQPVFIFVDNGLRGSDLEKLLPINQLPLLPPQSRILLTTRNLNETNIFLQKGIGLSSYKVNSLPLREAEKILCEYALGDWEKTFDGTIDIKGLLQICSGIPLVLKMAAYKLRQYAESVADCKEAVDHIKEGLVQGGDAELSERMVDFVYNRLQQSCKEAFFDIVFFFNYDWKRCSVANIVGEIELQELERAALVNVTEGGELNVHDIVKARGKMLSNGDGYRITDEELLSDVLQDDQKIKETKGIYLSFTSEIQLEAKHLNLMSRSVRVLHLIWNNIVNGEWKGTFENLRFLSLGYHNYLRMRPSKLPRLKAFYGFFFGDRFYEFSGEVPSLKEMQLHNATCTIENLTTTLRQLKSLRSLSLDNCGGFTNLPEIIGNLSSLTELKLKGCSSLTSIPNSFGNLFSLTELDLMGCLRLTSIPDSFSNLSSLTRLILRDCSSLTSIPDSFGNLSSLKRLNLMSCSSLTSIPDSFGNLSSLKELNLISCSSLTSIPNSFGNLSSLKELDLRYCSSLTSIPDSFGNLSSLKRLDLMSCSSLTSIPDSFGNLSSLKRLDLMSCSSLTSIPDSFGNLSSLTQLILRYCSSLTSIPDSFGNLSSLKELDLRSCSSLTSIPDSFGNLSSLTQLILRYCSSLTSIPNSFGNLSSLKELNLMNCSSLTSIPNSFGNLSSLKGLNLMSCSSLTSISDSFGNLSSLKELNLISCSSLTSIPDSFGNLSSLRVNLDLSGCSNLESIPNNFGNLLFRMKRLKLTYCSNLAALPESLIQLNSLSFLDLSGCTQLSVLPQSFGNISSLELLNMGECEKLSYLPQNFGELKFLKYVSIHGCKELHSLSSDFGSLSSLVAIKASDCPQLEEKTMDILAEIKSLIFADIGGSPMLIKRWEQVKDQCLLPVSLCGRQEFRAEIMSKVFFRSESKFVQVDDDGMCGESSIPTAGVKLGLLVIACDLTSPTIRTSLEKVTQKCVEFASKGFHIIYEDMQEGLWEETETRVRQTLSHLPRGITAWIAPHDKARRLFCYSCYSCLNEDPYSDLEYSDWEYVYDFMGRTSWCVDKEGRKFRLGIFRLGICL